MGGSDPLSRPPAQMHTLQDEFSSLQEAKASELEEVEQELQEAQEELRGLRQATEEAAALHANEVATLQEQLCRLRAELHRAHVLRDDYELELASLRAEIHMKGGPRADAMAPREVAALQGTAARGGRGSGTGAVPRGGCGVQRTRVRGCTGLMPWVLAPGEGVPHSRAGTG